MPLAIDLCSGLGGWAEGLEAEGWTVIRVDIADMFAATGTAKPPNCLLIVQDILTIHGSQFRNADLIVASPPCQRYSYMAMPWTRAKEQARRIRADDTGGALMALNELFDACFRIQREACEAAGRHIPMVVENVRGARPWVGRANYNYGSFYLWGDVPVFMPEASKPPRKVPGFRFDGSGKSFQTASVEGVKQSGIGGPRDNGKGEAWFQDGAEKHGSKSSARKRASAMIAKIPLPLSTHIARVFKPA